MRITAAITGNLRESLEREIAAGKKATTEVIDRAGKSLKEKFRAQVTGAGLGQRLANTIRSQTFPVSGQSLNAASLVWAKAPHILEAFDTGTVIKAAGGRYLSVPTENAPKRGTGGTKISPKNWPAARLGELRLGKTDTGRLVLLVDNLRQRSGKRGGFAKASKTAIKKGEAKTVVMFFLIPSARLQKLTDFARDAEQIGSQIPAQIIAAWDRYSTG
jgi:hypothetical protein